MTDVFLSYSREDQATARKVAEALERDGLSVWWDQALKSGEAFDRVTEKALDEAKAVVVLWSKASVESRWVRAEATQADRAGKLVPVTIEECKRPIMFELTHTAELAGWNGNPGDVRWQGLVRDLRSYVSGQPTPTASAAIPDRSVSDRATRSAGRLVALGLLALAVAGAVTWALLRDPTETTVSSTASSTTAPIASIAVLPFVNRTGDPEKEYFGDGMAEGLINALTTVSGLRVAARQSAFVYKGQDRDVRQIAKDLAVRAVLQGSVQSAGEDIRLNVQLVDGTGGYNLWSAKYDREFKDVFKLQDELTSAIVQAVRTRMNASDLPEASPSVPPTKDTEAYRLYLQARSVAISSTPAVFERADALLRQAIERDPNFAEGMASLASNFLVEFVRGYKGPAALNEAERKVSQSLAIDPANRTAIQVRAGVLAIRGKWVEADRLGSESGGYWADTSLHTVLVLGPVGQFSRIRTSLGETFDRNPTVAAVAMMISALQLTQGMDEDSARNARLAVDLGVPSSTPPMPRILSDLARHAGRHEEAARIAAEGLRRDVLDAGGKQAIDAVFQGLADPAKRPSALSALRELSSRLTPAHHTPDFDMNVLQWFTLLGSLDDAYKAAYETLERYRRDGVAGPLWIWLWPPDMRPFRQDPRFQELTTKIGLMDYWQQVGPPDSCDLSEGKLRCH